MKELLSGSGWCKECKQIVNVYSNDEGRTFHCGFCDKEMKNE